MTGDSSTMQASEIEALRERLSRAKANGDPAKYLAGISVAEAHEAADALTSLLARAEAAEAKLADVREATKRAFRAGYQCAGEDENRFQLRGVRAGWERYWQEHLEVHPSLAAQQPEENVG